MLSQIETQRLALRTWQSDDLPAFYAYQSDPDVRAFFPNRLTKAQAADQLARLVACYDHHGFSFLPVIEKQSGLLVGHCGLLPVDIDFGLNRNCAGVEIGWTLAKAHWGQGYGVEIARAVIECAETHLGLADVVSFTTIGNVRSQALMKKLDMHCWGTFDHPKLPPGDRLRKHVLYRRKFLNSTP